MIEQKAQTDVRVIGRGTQLFDSKTEAYITAVAGAILRGVSYTRILVIDPALPQNALLWLMFFERFLGSAEWRDSVHLYKKQLLDSNTSQQFQIVDERFLHKIVRYYSKADPGAAQRSQSTFALKPDGQVDQHWNIYENHLRDAGPPYRHKEVFELLTKMLHCLDRENQAMSYHWKHALDVVSFSGRLERSRCACKSYQVRWMPDAVYVYFSTTLRNSLPAEKTRNHKAIRSLPCPFSEVGRRYHAVPGGAPQLCLRTGRQHASGPAGASDREQSGACFAERKFEQD